MSGKGMTPKKGYNQKLYFDNYGKINWRKKPKKKTNENKLPKL